MKISKQTIKAIVTLLALAVVGVVIALAIKVWAPAVDTEACISGIGQLL